MKKNEYDRGLPLGLPQPELFNITEGSLIEKNEQIVAQNPQKMKLSGNPASFQAPEKKEDYLENQTQVFSGCSQEGQLRPSVNINGRSGSAQVSPICYLVEAIAAHLTHSLSEKGGAV